MTQAHGQEETRPTTLDQIWGDTGQSKYGTMDEKVYNQQLVGMNKSDLQAHAIKVGLVPIDDRERLTKTLMHEFRMHVASFRHPKQKLAPAAQIPPEVTKILAEGR